MRMDQALLALSQTVDLVGRGASIRTHHLRVTYICGRLADLLNLSEDERKELLWAASIHDLGVSKSAAMADLAHFEVIGSSDHCTRGHKLLLRFSPLARLAPIILHHHDAYSDAPKLARIIHLADRAAVLARQNIYILHQKSHILNQIRARRGTIFDPHLVKALEQLGLQEAFWLDLESDAYLPLPGEEIDLDLQGLVEFAGLIADIVDHKSSHTALHSQGVAAVARGLGQRAGMEEPARLYIAGLLHDLGKLAIPDAILDKPGKLSAREMAVMRQHTYHTYTILSRVASLRQIAGWAAYHHERLDGNGYPFRLKAADLDLGARCMAVADMFQALNQNRPYRPAMRQDQVLEILEKAVREGALDGDLTAAIAADYPHFHNLAMTGAIASS